MGRVSKILWALVLLLALLSLPLAVFMRNGFAQSGTNVSGIISSDYTWVLAGSPYNLTDNVLVDSAVTLTIGAGTTINLNGFCIIVNGSLIVQQRVTINMGNANAYILVNGVLSANGEDPNGAHIYVNGNMSSATPLGAVCYSRIIFSPSSVGWDNATNSGSIIEYALVNQVEIDINSSVRINNDGFMGGELSISEGFSQVYDNSISCLVYVNGGNCSLVHNEIGFASIVFSRSRKRNYNNDIFELLESLAVLLILVAFGLKVMMAGNS